ncbi:MAG: hypothetical protein J6Q55_00085, partial [Clostridia bacterium]|nr:hypothetical protein [Clostridia bacterium]
MFSLLLIGQPIQWLSLVIVVAIMAAVAIVLGFCIMLISHLCRINEDPRIAEVEGFLAGANCGACGYAGCADFAKAIVAGTADMSACNVTSAAGKAEISNIMGVSIIGQERTVAVVSCAGGNKCQDKCSYQGYGDCVSQSLLAGGRKACDVGCMGSGTCVTACPYDALEIEDG